MLQEDFKRKKQDLELAEALFLEATIFLKDEEGQKQLPILEYEEKEQESSLGLAQSKSVKPEKLAKEIGEEEEKGENIGEIKRGNSVTVN